MKLTTLDADLRIHQKLEDEPNDVGGLSAQALKEKFDQAGVTIQKYLNETHLPEEEAAVADALSQAKAYTDKRAAALEQRSMMSAVYDTKNRRRDVFDYTDEKIAALDAKTDNKIMLCGGDCYLWGGMDMTRQLSEFTSLTDPHGLWSATEKAFVVPEGGKLALTLMNIRSACDYGTKIYLRLYVNGKERASRSLGWYTNATWDYEPAMFTLAVKEGDKITVEIAPEARVDTGRVAQAELLQMSVMILT